MIWTPERQLQALVTCDKWHGTPHKDRLAILGIGIDCIRFLNEIMIDCGIVKNEPLPWYNVRLGMHSRSDTIKKGMLACYDCQEIRDVNSPQFGDVCIFTTGRMSGHCAFYTNGQIWHSLARAMVMQSDYRIYRRELDCLIRINGIGYKQVPTSIKT